MILILILILILIRAPEADGRFERSEIVSGDAANRRRRRRAPTFIETEKKKRKQIPPFIESSCNGARAESDPQDDEWHNRNHIVTLTFCFSSLMVC